MAFEKIDKPCLQPLPAKRYVYSDWKETKVASNYHVEYDGTSTAFIIPMQIVRVLYVQLLKPSRYMLTARE